MKKNLEVILNKIFNLEYLNFVLNIYVFLFDWLLCYI